MLRSYQELEAKGSQDMASTLQEQPDADRESFAVDVPPVASRRDATMTSAAARNILVVPLLMLVLVSTAATVHHQGAEPDEGADCKLSIVQQVVLYGGCLLADILGESSTVLHACALCVNQPT